jgi:DNA N-6-adenine-methyltransferase Dam
MAHELITGDSFLPRTMSGSNDWWTPPAFIEAARKVMGSIDLDPASCTEANQIVRAERYYTIADDGLTQRWYGNVWCNPPYGRTSGKGNQELWTHKLITEYECGNVEQAILLINACMGTACVQRLINEYPLCFVRGRIRFIAPGRSESSPTHDNLLAYFGRNEQCFIEVFSRFGKCIPALNKASVPSLWDSEVAS